MRRLLQATLAPTGAILIAALFAPSPAPVAEPAESVAAGAQVQYLQPHNPNPNPMDWLERSAHLLAQLAPGDRTGLN